MLRALPAALEEAATAERPPGRSARDLSYLETALRCRLPKPREAPLGGPLKAQHANWLDWVLQQEQQLLRAPLPQALVAALLVQLEAPRLLLLLLLLPLAQLLQVFAKLLQAFDTLQVSATRSLGDYRYTQTKQCSSVELFTSTTALYPPRLDCTYLETLSRLRSCPMGSSTWLPTTVGTKARDF